MTINQIGEIKNSTSIPSNSGTKGIKIRFKIIENQKLKAIASLDLGWAIIKGFRLNFSNFKNEKGEDDLWVIPPSYSDGGNKWHPIFYMTNKLDWKELEARIKIEYSKALNMHYKKRMGIADNESEANEFSNLPF